MRAGGSTVRRLANALSSTLDPRIYLHGLKLLHYYNYSHVSPRRRAIIGADVRLAPNVSFVNGERISIGARAQIGARCHLWAGNTTGRVVVGEDAAGSGHTESIGRRGRRDHPVAGMPPYAISGVALRRYR